MIPESAPDKDNEPANPTGLFKSIAFIHLFSYFVLFSKGGWDTEKAYLFTYWYKYFLKL